jgi:hypothetical protein
MQLFKRTILREAPARTPYTLTLHNASGRIQVRGEERLNAAVAATIEVLAFSSQEAESYFEQVEAAIAFGDGFLTIEGPDPGSHGIFHRPRLKMRYEIDVPRETRAEITVANGPVDVRQIVGPLEIKAANGPTRIEDIEQAVEVATINGPTRILRCGANVAIEVVNGPLTLAQVSGSAKLHATNGPLTLERIGSHVEAAVLNGPINYEGAIGGNFDLSAQNGGIVLRLPSDSRFELDAEAARGIVQSEFRVDEDHEGTTGEAHRVHLRTENGGIHLHRVS